MAKFSIALLACLRGSICLYQGEELGFGEADLAFEDLRDPYGIRFWPGYKGRDGCRTPMVWEAQSEQGGFTDGKPWLPIPDEHRALAVDRQQADERSVLAHYREVLAARRRHPALVAGTIRVLDAEGDVLAFKRQSGGERLLCVFNFSDVAVSLALTDEAAKVELCDFAGSAGVVEPGTLQVPGLGYFIGRLI